MTTSVTVFLAPAPINQTQFIPGGNQPAAGAQLFFYAAGTSTKQNTYTTSSGAVANSNPIILDSGGNVSASHEVWLAAGLTYDAVLAPSTDTDPPVSPYWTAASLSGINDTTQTINEWIAGPAPTFVTASTFTVSGDQTGVFTRGRRVKATVTAGTVYGMVANSVFTTSTSVQVMVENSALDSGLSAVSYGILSGINLSTPGVSSTNTFYGVGALSSNVFLGFLNAGDQNTAFGFEALTSNSAASTLQARNNVAFGSLALQSNTIGTQNCAIGNQTLQTNTTGSNNVAVGNAALHDSNADSNTAVGIDSLRHNTNGTLNTAIGLTALATATSASLNTAVGAAALNATITGAGCVGLGYKAGAYELSSNAFYINNFDTGSLGADRASSFMFGLMTGNPLTASLSLNAQTIFYGTQTNDSAAAGRVGEFKDAFASGVSVSTTPTNITSIVLTNGDWDVSAQILYSGGAGNSTVALGISTTNNTFTGTTGKDSLSFAAVSATGSGAGSIPRIRYSISSATFTVFLNGSLSASPTTCSGYISARRMR